MSQFDPEATGDFDDADEETVNADSASSSNYSCQLHRIPKSSISSVVHDLLQARSQVSTMGGSFFAQHDPRLLLLASLACTHCALGVVAGGGARSYNRERGSTGPRAERGGVGRPPRPPPFCYGPVIVHVNSKGLCCFGIKNVLVVCFMQSLDVIL